MPEAAAFGALQQHDADKRDHDHEMDDDQIRFAWNFPAVCRHR